MMHPIHSSSKDLDSILLSSVEDEVRSSRCPAKVIMSVARRYGLDYVVAYAARSAYIKRLDIVA